MLDKTGTITLGNRQAAEFIPVDGVDPAELADAAQLSSLADETPEGRSIVVLAKEQFGLRGRTLEDKGMEFIPFTAATRMSGVNYEGNEIRKGAADSVRAYVEAAGGVFSQECDEAVERIAKAGGTPLVVTQRTAACWALCTSRTSSSPALRRSSPTCARWASRPSCDGRQPAHRRGNRRRGRR